MTAADGAPEIRNLLDHTRPDLRDPEAPRPVRTHLYEPVTERTGPPPVVLVSHGTGASAGDMEWMTRPLAAAGFLAVSVDHHGNNWVDGYLAQGFAFQWERPADFRFVLDTLAAERPLGPVGAAGFSLGGYTAAALLGARIDADLLPLMLAGRIETPPLPEFPRLIETLRAELGEEEALAVLGPAGADLSDPRVRAAFLVAPASGQMVTTGSLAATDRPVEIRWGGADTITPPESDALHYLRHLPRARGRSVGEDVPHHYFFPGEPAGEKIRRTVAEEAVDFFRAQLTNS